MNILENLSFNLTSRSDKIEYVVYDQSETHLLDEIKKLFDTFNYSPWIFSLIGSVLVGLSGVFPLLVINLEDGADLKCGAGSSRLRLLLSFAVGGLLGDVFLHLLPEAWEHRLKSGSSANSSMLIGVWVIIGLLIFITVQKICSSVESDKGGMEAGKGGKLRRIPSGDKKNSSSLANNNNDRDKSMSSTENTEKPYHISGYLNLVANFVDNFSHGMSIGGSFSISLKIGILSTFAILIHELPHEIGDFAILLKSGFSRWDAAKAQMFTAFAGILGSMMVVVCGSGDSIEEKTSWLIPFTAGGFLHIALVTVLPDLVNEESSEESFKQLCSLVFGIGIMAFMITFFG